ncbi:flavin-containing monooxygenase FMO GS-OX-like 4 [Hordeum vulgare subsp. vulgare]|uniref:Flavin-containing monooxygenase n=1 Tax=Hordeum vulgare subsp. vulgare TaxID=112509 RepID=A0A8I6XLM9_HORVV|nr:flavin-containing monooxygenase FMO GS-OX-like 4 [Hordeum vulgare subsp. vulgare]
MPSSRVAVIGAGAAGLVAARELRREGHTPVVFERAAGVGGSWRYQDAASADPLGAGGVHGSLYASLRTNLPRECMGFLDFPFVADEGSVDPRRFPGHQEVLRYLEEFARRFHLLGLIRLETDVVSVRRDTGGRGRWRVSSSSPTKLAGEPEEARSELFDAVVVCNGHFAEPRLAEHIAGMDGWPGKQTHSHSYRLPDPFHGQVVVIIGYNPSGMDISRDIAGVAKEVHVAIRAAPAEMQSATAHANLWLHPMVDRAEEDGGVVFQDGSRVKADAIVHCTGYKYNFPFLDGDQDGDPVIAVDDNRVGPLYKHVFPPHLAPHISFIGLPFKAILFPVFQLQSSWVAGVLSGRIELPSPEEMTQEVAAFYSDMEARGCPKRFTHDLGASTFEYEDWLAERSGLERMEEWRRAIYVAARGRLRGRPESYRDEWDDDAHLLDQAHRDFAKYL